MRLRQIVENPVPGGERFSLLIGPSLRSQRLVRGLLGGALLAWGIAALGGLGLGVPVWAGLGLAAAASAVGLGSLNRAERLVCEGGRIRFTGAGLFRPVASRPALDVLTVARSSAPRGGLEIRFGAGPWRLGRGLSVAEADEIVARLRRHLALDQPAPGAPRARARRSAAHEPAAMSPDDALRRRHPTG